MIFFNNKLIFFTICYNILDLFPLTCYNSYMNNTNYFFIKPETFIVNAANMNSDLMVPSIGYHNFHYVKPWFTPRIQPFHTLHFVISGKGILHVNDKIYHLQSNEVFWLDNKSLISYYPDPDDPWEYVFFNYEGKIADNYAKLIGFNNSCHVKKCLSPQKILFILSSLFENQAEKHFISNFEILSAFYCLLASIYSFQQSKHIFDEQVSINEIKYYIKLKYLEPDFNIKSLCECMHISHTHLCRIFKKYENCTIIEYITKIKMDYAKNLLSNTNYSIFKISTMCGYDSYEHFLRLFKKLHNCSPSEYRIMPSN